mgnify:CR=1 FL=1
MTMTLCTLDELPADQAIERPDPRSEDGSSLILLRAGSRICAYLNVCPHAGRPLNWAPGRFLYAHGQLVCAAHSRGRFLRDDGIDQELRRRRVCSVLAED